MPMDGPLEGGNPETDGPSQGGSGDPRLAELEAFLAIHPDTQFVDAVFMDLCGIERGKRYPRSEVHKLYTDGLQIPDTIYALDVTGANTDPAGKGFSDGDPDGVGVPVPGTLVPVPWGDEPSGQVLMTLMTQQMQPSIIDPRNVLARVAARFEDLGLTPVVALELEFYLIDPKRARDGRPQPPVAPGSGERERSTQVYGLAEIEGFAGFIQDIDQACQAQHIPASVATAEFAPGQYEINLRHVPSPMDAADDASLLCRVVRNIAPRHGARATFMAKPYAEQTGSGLHIHMSLLDRDGRNVFDDDGRLDGSSVLHHAIGGLAAAMPESMAVFAPNVNGYRRFGANLFVPTRPSWAVNNRSVAFRIPGGPGASRRVEHRVAGADANPYLALAALLAGAHHGIVNEIDPGPMATGNAGEELDPAVPFTLPEAIRKMSRGQILRDYFTPEYVEIYTATKFNEYRDYCAIIPPHEYDWYL